MNSSNELESTETTESNNLTSMDEEKITVNYLRKHYDFFYQHKDLLMSLKIPHVSGGAVSLIERQVEHLREQNTQLEKNLDELVSIAKDNESSNQRMHQLTLALLDCETLDAIAAVMDEILCDTFFVDHVKLRLFIQPAADQTENLFAKPGSDLVKELEKILNKRQPACGFFKNLPLQPLFEDQADKVASLAVIPLFIEKNSCFGALVLGSHNDSRFNAEMGTHFLQQLGELLSHALIRYIPE